MLFSEIIGQDEIKQRLIQTVQKGRIPHAQLFCGISGVGKLPLALAYAQYICCTDRQSDDSCGKCPSCVKFAKLIHPDLHFVFPIVKNEAKKLTVCNDFLPEFRQQVLENPYLTEDEWITSIAEGKQGQIYTNEGDEIIRKLSFKAYESEYKVMIIWQPEKMHESCANRVLKIIEEPSEKTVFILVSNQPEEIIATIQSRLQRINIPPIADSCLYECLSERGVVGDDADFFVRSAQGSWSALRGLLEAHETQQEYFRLFVIMMRLAWTVDVKGIRELIETLASFGREGQKSFLEEAQRQLRENFILRLGHQQLNFLTKEQEAFAQNFSKVINEANIIPIMEEMQLAAAQIEQNSNAKIVFFDMILVLNRLLKTKK